jgi:hypothetical protein
MSEFKFTDALLNRGGSSTLHQVGAKLRAVLAFLCCIGSLVGGPMVLYELHKMGEFYAISSLTFAVAMTMLVALINTAGMVLDSTSLHLFALSLSAVASPLVWFVADQSAYVQTYGDQMASESERERGSGSGSGSDSGEDDGDDIQLSDFGVALGGCVVLLLASLASHFVVHVRLRFETRPSVADVLSMVLAVSLAMLGGAFTLASAFYVNGALAMSPTMQFLVSPGVGTLHCVAVYALGMLAAMSAPSLSSDRQLFVGAMQVFAAAQCYETLGAVFVVKDALAISRDESIDSLGTAGLSLSFTAAIAVLLWTATRTAIAKWRGTGSQQPATPYAMQLDDLVPDNGSSDDYDPYNAPETHYDSYSE